MRSPWMKREFQGTPAYNLLMPIARPRARPPAKASPRSIRPRRGWRLVPRRAIALGALAAVAVLMIALGLGARRLMADLPDPDRLLERAAPETTKLYDRRGRLLHEVLDPRAGRRTRVALDEIPQSVVDAVLSIEDADYFDHPGIDARAIARASVQGIRHGRIVSGASTITQQLARQVLMTPDERSQRTLPRKLREAVLALRIERRFDKATILELYLNEVYFGQLAYGIEAAARTYFGKPAHTLDLAEAALLAGLIQAPATYNPLIDLDAARARQHLVLGRMERLGHIDAEAEQTARDERLRFDAGPGPSGAPHFATWVIGRLEAEMGSEAVAAGGLHVVTSIDLDLQRRAHSAIAQHLAALAADRADGIDHNAGNGALVAIDPESGDVLAMVGSTDHGDATIDGAVNIALAARQPGSAYKPMVYAAAMDPTRWGLRPSSRAGRPAQLPFTAGTVMSDVRTAFTTREGEPYRPQNYDRKWHGPLALRTALATSSNMVAVKVLEATGLEPAIETGEDLGIGTFVDRDRYGLALALGGAEVRLLDLTAAYGAFAVGGRRVDPRPILAVLDGPTFRAWAEAAADLDGADATALLDGLEGTVPDPARRRVLDPRVAYLITDILSDDTARLPAFGEGSPLALSRPAAAKTGTTTDFRDNWTVGYTPELVTGVWVGNADNSPMQRVTGISGAGPIWRAFMESAHAGRPVRSFERPPGLVEVEVCAPSGLRPTALCSRRMRELFIDGTQPIDEDDAYVRLNVDSATGALWTDACGGTPIERTFLRLPADAEAWAAGRGIAQPPRFDCAGRAGGPGGERTASGSPPESAPAIRLARPAAGSTFAISSQIPLDAQRIEFEAVAPSLDVRRLRLLVGDEVVAERTAPPWRGAWLPIAGRHEAVVEAEGHDGSTLRSAPIRFGVVDEAELAALPP